MNATVPPTPIKAPASLRILRWTARVWSLVSLGVVVLFAVGEGMNLARFTPGELVMFLCFPLGVMLGMALAWGAGILGRSSGGRQPGGFLWGGLVAFPPSAQGAGVDGSLRPGLFIFTVWLVGAHARGKN